VRVEAPDPAPTRAVMMDELLDVLTARPAGDGQTFKAQSIDWFGPRLFGGTIVAQALNAVLQTVPADLRPHSFHGYFLRAVEAGPDSELRVEHLRDGRTFTTRRVTTSQGGKDAFVAMCSFCADEDGDEYQPALTGIPGPDEIEPWPTSEGPIDMRDLGPTPVRDDGTMASTRRVWFGVEPLADDALTHATLLAYMSDMTGTSFRPLSLGDWGAHTDASLDHAVWFHRPARADGWLFYDLHALINAGGRSTVRGEMYTSDGHLCLSLAQELLIRPLGTPPTPWPPTP
jgi:acyl-CoA thioesterase II